MIPCRNRGSYLGTRIYKNFFLRVEIRRRAVLNCIPKILPSCSLRFFYYLGFSARVFDFSGRFLGKSVRFNNKRILKNTGAENFD